MGKKVIAYWGTGNISRLLHENKRIAEPEFYIESSFEKCKETFNGKEVKHYSDINCWKDLFVIIAMDNYLSVQQYLESIGLLQDQDYVWYGRFMDSCCQIGQICDEAEKFLQQIAENVVLFKGKKLLFSDFLAYDKGICDYMNKLSEKEDLVLMSEASMKLSNAANKMKIPIVTLPYFCQRLRYAKGNEPVCCLEQAAEYVKDVDYLKEATQNLRMRYKDMRPNYEILFAYYSDRIIRLIIDLWEPQGIILWNAFYAFHKIIRTVCKEKGIDVKYMEFGNIPGTIVLESIGQMGESWPARYPEEFMKIPVSEQEFKETEQFIENLRTSGVNRNLQPQNNKIEILRKKISVGRPIVFYAGQNDNACGLQPYTYNSEKFHSPVFKSSDEAAVYLAGLCEKENWNFIYKPHPMMAEVCNMTRFPSNTVFINDANINELIDMADVVVTIVSTVSYIALIREKPVVMLGYTQLKGKGCTYEAFVKEQILECLRGAINNVQKGEMQNAFIRHVVQMEKYIKCLGEISND